MPDDPSRTREFGYYLALAGIGFEMVAPIVIGAMLDLNFPSWAPWATLAGVVLGFTISLVHLWALLKRMDQKPPRQSQRDES
jgi:membrane protein implicated in regulation of membrane protease activity